MPLPGQHPVDIAADPKVRRAAAQAQQDRRISSLEQNIGEPWKALSLLNGWTVYSATPNGYYKDPNGIVRVKGEIQAGTTTIGTNIFVLPAGYRPLERKFFPVLFSTGVGAVALYPDGSVRVETALTASVILHSLNAIIFRAES